MLLLETPNSRQPKCIICNVIIKFIPAKVRAGFEEFATWSQPVHVNFDRARRAALAGRPAGPHRRASASRAFRCAGPSPPPTYRILLPPARHLFLDVSPRPLLSSTLFCALSTPRWKNPLLRRGGVTSPDVEPLPSTTTTTRAPRHHNPHHSRNSRPGIGCVFGATVACSSCFPVFASALWRLFSIEFDITSEHF